MFWRTYCRYVFSRCGSFVVYAMFEQLCIDEICRCIKRTLYFFLLLCDHSKAITVTFILSGNSDQSSPSKNQETKTSRAKRKVKTGQIEILSGFAYTLRCSAMAKLVS